MKHVVAALVCVALAGCASHPPLRSGNFGAYTGKALYAAIKEVDATPEQRTKILLAYDIGDLKWQQQRNEAAEVIDSWRKLDRKAPDFSARVDQLAARWGALHTAQMQSQSLFDTTIAEILDAAQWRKWREYTSLEGLPNLENLDEDDGPRGRGRAGRRID